MTGDDMRRARRALGLTEAMLARTLDVNDRTVRRWERDGQKIPLTVATLVQLAVKHALVRRELGIVDVKAKPDGADKRQKAGPALPG